jgi:hypothetical protein
MTPGRRLAAAGLAVVAAVLAWLLFIGLPRWYGAPVATRAVAAPSAAAPLPPGRKIKARLFYVADDGMRLVATERDVPFSEGTVEQAREIINVQIAPVAEPTLSAVPPGTRLRSLFVGEHGDAYVNLSREFSSSHEGGSLNELLTVYTIVDALTVNLPAVTSVQVLVEGKEVDTLAGHIDLRRPLPENLAWVQ